MDSRRIYPQIFYSAPSTLPYALRARPKIYIITFIIISEGLTNRFTESFEAEDCFQVVTYSNGIHINLSRSRLLLLHKFVVLLRWSHNWGTSEIIN